MGDYLELALAVIEGREGAVLADTASLLMNEIQCTHLWRVIRIVYNYLVSNQVLLANCKRQCFTKFIFEEFFLLVTRADNIVQQFSSLQDWLIAAFLHGNDRLAFKELILGLQELILGLQDCVDSFYKRTGYPISAGDSATIWRQDADMEGDARLDTTQLRSRVKVLLALPDLGNDERLLAQIIIEREESMIASSDSQGIDVQQFLIAKGRYPTSGTQIGDGASGVVLEVKWLLHMICAKKIFSDETDNEGPIQKEGLKEASILSKLNHPHIVKLLCISEPPEVSILMELMPMNLYDFIKNHHKNGITPGAAIDMMLQIAQGIEFMHDQDIAHRDVKSPNILVSPSHHPKLQEDGYGVLKLADLGLAKMKARDLTMPTRQKIGTAPWMAPEAFTADKPIDWKKADAYSFAMVCCEILTGDIPFSSGPPRSELYNRIMSGERPTLPSSCPDALASLLKKCWSTIPSTRPSFSHIRKDLTHIKRRLLTGSLEWSTWKQVRNLKCLWLSVLDRYKQLKSLDELCRISYY